MKEIGSVPFVNWIDLRWMQFGLVSNGPNKNWCHKSRAQWILGKAIFLKPQQIQNKTFQLENLKVFFFERGGIFFKSWSETFRPVALLLAVSLIAFWQGNKHPRCDSFFQKSSVLKHKWPWPAREKAFRAPWILRLPSVTLFLASLLLGGVAKGSFYELKHVHGRTMEQKREEK